MPNQTPLGQAVRRTAEVREQWARAQEILAHERAAFDQTHALLLSDLAQLAECVATEEAALRAALVAQGRGKHLGGEVKAYAVLEYEAAAAFAWAQEHALCLALDTKAFEQLAKASPLPGVTVRSELRASLARDLRALCPPEETPDA